MRKYLITTVSTLALLLGASTAATAQNAQDPVTQNPAVHSPSAGSMNQEGAMSNGAMHHQTPSAASSSSAAEKTASATSYKSYSANKKALSGVSIPGGRTADQLIGADVSNAQGDKIGEIDDLLVDSSNQVRQAVISVGGFLGMGSKDVAVELSQLQAGGKKKGFVTNMTKDELKALPEYKKQNGMWTRSLSKSD